MHRTAALLAVSALLAVGGVACGDDEEAVDVGGTPTTAPGGGAPSDPVTTDYAALVDGVTFTATSVTGYDLAPGATLGLIFADGSLGITGGCNTQNAPYVVDGDRLTLTGDAMSTMMACDQPLMDQDTWIVGLLQAGATLSGTADALTLTSGDVVIELTSAAAGSDAALVGPTWTLDSIIDGETASNVPAGVEAPTVTFADDGTVSVFTGCNRGSTTVKAGATTITFAPLATTKMACEPDAMALEATVAAVLDGDVAYELDGDSLSLTNGTQSLVFRAT